jgi:hypothetical protein
MPQATIGRIVHYRLSEQDVQLIDEQHPMTGADGRRNPRNPVAVGQICPAMVVRIFDPGPYVNLQVFLDGGAGAEYWATSRVEGDEPGQWSWPPRV